MAIKKSDIYSSIWASRDELRGGIDASQYKDYVLFMLFIKYISDKYGNSDALTPPVVIPKGASFTDMIGRLSNLVGIFRKPELDFPKNRAIKQGMMQHLLTGRMHLV